MCLVSRLWSCLNVRVERVDVSLDVLTLLLDWKEPYRMISEVFCWLPHFRVYMNLFLSGGIRKVVTKTTLSTLTITGLIFFVIQDRDKRLKQQAGACLTPEAWGLFRAVSHTSAPACSLPPRKQTGCLGCGHVTTTNASLRALLPTNITFSSLGCLIFSCQHFRGAQIGYIL